MWKEIWKRESTDGHIKERKKREEERGKEERGGNEEEEEETWKQVLVKKGKEGRNNREGED